MISGLLESYASAYPERLFLADATDTISAREAVERVRQLVPALERLNQERIFFYCRDSAQLVLAILATEAAGLQCCIVNRQAEIAEVEAILQRVGNGVLVTDSAESFHNAAAISITELARNANAEIAPESHDPGKPSGTIVVLTTGTTGLPKPALHTWDKLLGRLPAKDAAQDKTWLLVYPLNHFAGIQVLLAALRDKSTLIIPQGRDFSSAMEAIIRHHVTCISATPTFWRMLAGRITAEQVNQLAIEQITLGGEASTAELLQILKSRFPSAHITQVYATTEAGTCFAVKDGMPGFPASYLERPVGNVRLKIVDGELYIQSAAAMAGYLGNSAPSPMEGDWIKTGDLVELAGDRVLFRGRKSEVINVGGVKVHPLKVEEVILGVPGVLAVRVFGTPNPITGQIVACDLELEEQADEAAVRGAVQKACLTMLNRYEQPRQIKVVNRLERRNEKIVRRGSA